MTGPSARGRRAARGVAAISLLIVAVLGAVGCGPDPTTSMNTAQAILDAQDAVYELRSSSADLQAAVDSLRIELADTGVTVTMVIAYLSVGLVGLRALRVAHPMPMLL